jgi:hypothetical protein
MLMLFRHRLSLQGDRRWLSGPMHGLQEYPAWIVTAAGAGRPDDEDRLADGMSLVAQARSPVSVSKESVHLT